MYTGLKPYSYIVQGDQLNMAVFFWYIANSVQCTCAVAYKSLFTRYQKITAMFIWSPCM